MLSFFEFLFTIMGCYTDSVGTADIWSNYCVAEIPPISPGELPLYLI